MILEPIHSLYGSGYSGVLDLNPALSRPDLVEQLIAGEQDAACHHGNFVVQCEDVLAASSRAFKTAPRRDRAAAEELRGLP